MQFPLIGQELIANLKLVHGSFNLTVVLLFFCQARNGLLIRGARRKKTPPPLSAIMRHRRMGPLLVFLGPGGFAAGLTLVFVDTGQFFLYPAHFSVGIAILLTLFLTYRVSQKIAGASDPRRVLHFRLGVTLLALYLVNVVLGVGMLF